MRGYRVLGGVIVMSALAFYSQAEAGEARLADVIKEMLGTIDKLTVTLMTIKDEETAKSARPELRKSAAQWLLVREKAEKMKPPTKEEKERLEKEFKEKLIVAKKKLDGEIDRVKRLPGGKEALQEIRLVLDRKAKPTP
jgi:hypothetical protein